MKERIKNVLAFPLLILPTIFIISLLLNLDTLKVKDKEIDISSRFNKIIEEVLPFSKQLGQAGTEIRYITGESLQEDIFITNKGLIKNLPKVKDEVKNSNNKKVSEFAKKMAEQETNVYITIIPSTSAILQQSLPVFSTTVNQKNTIDNIYNQFAGEVVTINVYNTLLENKEKYIYYRTEDLNTSLGGYYIYSDIVRRMLVEGEIIPLTDFGVSYNPKEYYGKLYEKVPYEKIQSDTLSYYNYVKKPSYSLKQSNISGIWSYNELYDLSKTGLDTYLGSVSGVLKIVTEPAPELKLLILGDQTGGCYLPFLANHYNKVEFINLYDYNEKMLAKKIAGYDQVLIAVGIENYTQKDIGLDKLDY